MHLRQQRLLTVITSTSFLPAPSRSLVGTDTPTADFDCTSIVSSSDRQGTYLICSQSIAHTSPLAIKGTAFGDAFSPSLSKSVLSLPKGGRSQNAWHRAALYRRPGDPLVKHGCVIVG